MKDKIIYFALGAIVVLLTVILTKATDTTALDDLNYRVFENVLIQGKLIVGDNESKIVLDGRKDNANVIIDSKGSGIYILSKPNHSSITVTSDIRDLMNGAHISSFKEVNGDTDTYIQLKDSKGEKTISTNRGIK